MKVTQSRQNSTTAENFMRSAKAPTMRAGVIAAKVIWKQTNTYSGMVPLSVSLVMPARKALEKPPKSAPPSLKARV